MINYIVVSEAPTGTNNKHVQKIRLRSKLTNKCPPIICIWDIISYWESSLDFGEISLEVSFTKVLDLTYVLLPQVFNSK